MRCTDRQQGWAFLAVLAVLAIVAFLAREALMQYFGNVTMATRPHAAVAPPVPDGIQATPDLQTPLERARSVEATVLRQAEDAAHRIDERAR